MKRDETPMRLDHPGATMRRATPPVLSRDALPRVPEATLLAYAQILRRIVQKKQQREALSYAA